MRGTPRISRHSCSRRGIIPAYAGNTHSEATSRKMRRDHPRVCGEHIITAKAQIWNEGSSPRMRGTHENYDVTVYERGIIPAYAGNTGRP